MWESENITYWEQKPNRDEVLEQAYTFIEAVSNQELEKAGQLVRLEEPSKFITSLEKALLDFMKGWLEDDEIENIDRNVLSNLAHPADLQEEWVNPEFEGKSFFLDKGHEFSIHLGLQDRPTTLRVHFVVCEEDAMYYLKFKELTTNPNLPALNY